MKKLLLVLLLFSACASAPPNLSPAAATAWKQHEAQKDLDLVRDIAQDANAQQALSTATTRTITAWHLTAIRLVHEAPNGWKPLVLAGLDDLKRDVPAKEYAVIARYVSLARAVIQEVP